MTVKSENKAAKQLSFSGFGVFVGFGVVFFVGGLAMAASQSLRVIVWNLPASGDLFIGGVYATISGAILLVTCLVLAKRKLKY